MRPVIYHIIVRNGSLVLLDYDQGIFYNCVNFVYIFVTEYFYIWAA
jgi:hypothetical protein